MLQLKTLAVVSDGKLNILGPLKGAKVNIFQKLSKKSIFLCGCNLVTQKIITVNT